MENDKEHRRHLLYQKAKNVTTSPGVYLLKDDHTAVLYVGKAKNLRARLQTYFVPAGQDNPRIEWLVRQVAVFELILTQTEVEALILESTLIKKYRPRFNVRLKDDKSYPYLKIDYQQKYPKIEFTRSVKKDQAQYFGPFPSSWSARIAQTLLTEGFLLRDCSDNMFSHRKRPCLLYQMNRCSAPCVGLISVEQYQEDLEKAVANLQGRSESILNGLTEQMQKAVLEQDYEVASQLRDQVLCFRLVMQTQSVVDPHWIDTVKEVIGLARNAFGVSVVVLLMSKGKLVSVRHFALQNTDPQDSSSHLLSQFLMQHYAENPCEASELLISEPFEDPQQQLLLEQALQKKIMAPVEDQKAEYQLVCIAKTNAQYSLASQSKEKNHGLSACEAVQNVLHLKKLPVRIECYDISNFQGDDAVGSRVVFIDGKPEKQHYRRYKIKTVQGANDFAMLKEVLLRRFSSSVEEQVPDLLIVDGGKGQLAQAQRVIQELDIQGVAIAGLAKARKQKETEERIFLPLRKDPVVLKKNTPEFFLLTHIRDEAHRFAVGYHKKLRDHV